MAENENVMENEVQPEPKESKPSKGKNAGAAIKEWFRKRIVALKRAPHNIPFVYMVIVSFIWLVCLFTFSQAVDASAASYTGIAVFLTTLFSILVLALFLSAFPKRKKPNIVFIVLVFVFLVIIILSDFLYYYMETTFLSTRDPSFAESKPFIGQSLTLSITHMVLVGVGILLLATLPLYKKLILKINTKKVIESNDLTEEIDTSEEDG